MKKNLLRWGIATLLMAILIVLFQFDNRKIFAKPSDEVPIVLNEGTANQYILPFDSSGLFEDKLKLDPTYQGFVQNNTNTISMKKLENGQTIVPTTVFSSEISNRISATFVTGYGNIISLMEFTTFPYGSGYVNINATKIILQSERGEVLDSKWVFTEPPANNQNTGSKSVFYNSLYKVDDNSFTAVYSTSPSPINTTTYMDVNGKIEISSADNNRKIDLSSINTQNQSIQEQNKMFDQAVLSTGVMYSNALTKDYYVGVSYKNGELLDEWKMEADPLLKTTLVKPSIQYGGISKNSLIFTDAETAFGVEYMETSIGQYQNISQWKLDPVKKVGKRTELKKFKNASIELQAEISNEQEIYYQVINRNASGVEESVELWKLDVKKMDLKVVNIYPPLTRITYTKKGEGYIYIGQVMELTGYFEQLKIEPGIMTGYMNEDFSLVSGTSIKLTFSNEVTPISIAKFIYDGKNKYIISGFFESEEVFFVDQVVYGNYPGDMLGQGGKKWLSQARSPRSKNSFVSFLESKVDWAPAINKPGDIMIDLDDVDIKMGNPSILENWLLTGSKNGTEKDSKAIKVYDTYDIEESLSGSDQAWLNARINRNPLDTSLPIDWKSLGLDLAETGPQLLTYFITDSQMQTSTTSRWLNKIDDQTVYTEEYALSAENFAIPVEETGSLDAVIAKNASKIKLWELFGEHELIDDGTIDKNTAVVDSKQLKALQEVQSIYEAKKEQAEDPKFEDYSDVIKPYPLTISYEYQNNAGEMKQLKREITVFVTNETTQVDKQKNQVIYGFNFSYALKLAKNLTDEQIVSLSHASAWKYNHSWGVDTSSTTFTTNRSAPYQSGENEQKTGLNNARNPRNDYELSLTNDVLTNSLVRVKLYEDEVTLHVRQIIQNNNEALTLPSKGYLLLSNVNHKDAKEALQELPAVINTSLKGQESPYTTIKMSVSYDYYFYLPKVVLPEYYVTTGYVLTTKDETHDESKIVTDLPSLDFTENNEYWLSIYLKPIETQIRPYSWNYQSQSFN